MLNSFTMSVCPMHLNKVNIDFHFGTIVQFPLLNSCKDNNNEKYRMCELCQSISFRLVRTAVNTHFDFVRSKL